MERCAKGRFPFLHSAFFYIGQIADSQQLAADVLGNCFDISMLGGKNVEEPFANCLILVNLQPHAEKLCVEKNSLTINKK